MYYSDDLIEEIRMRNDIVDVVSGYVRLQKKGSTYFGLCPFHNEKSPSFSVTPAKQMYYCFGCGAGGNVFTFLMEYENLSFPEALRQLGERAGVELPKEEDYNPRARQEADLKAVLLEIHKEAARYFYYQLKSERGRIGWDYLAGKRQLSAQTITKFGLGYSGKNSMELYRYLKQKGYTDEALKESGLVMIEEKGAHDRFWNRVMFPIMDVRSRVIGFGGRVMGEGEPKYLNSPETKIFDKSRNLYGLSIAKNSRRPNIIICEGYVDVIALHQAGFDNAVASLGTAFTGGQASLIRRYTNEVLLTYDSDGAGTKAALRAIPILKEAGLSAKVIRMDPYKDPDEFIKNLGAEKFQERIDRARNSFLFEVDVAYQKYDMADPEQKTSFYNEIARMLLQFPEELERNNYLEAVCREYQINAGSLKSLVNRVAYQMPAPPKQAGTEIKAGKRPSKEDGVLKSQRLLLTWLIEDSSLFGKLEGIVGPEDFTGGVYQRAAQLLYDQYRTEGKVNPARIISCFETEEEQREAASLFNTSIRREMTIKEKERALNETVRRVKAHWCEYAGGRTTDLTELMEISKIKSSLYHLHISLE